jgi:opacity protein-like surface antigen
MSSRMLLKLAALTTSLSFVSLSAMAQAPTPQHGYVIGLGGLGATQVNAPFFGASAGFNLTPDLQVTFDVGRMQDAQATFTRDDLATLDSQVTAVAGLPFTSTIKVPTNYFTGGVRYLMPLGGAVRPYVAGSAGVAHMSPNTNFVAAGIDITTLLQTDPELRPYLTTPFREDTRPMASVGGGVVFNVVKHLAVDVGYKYSGIFIKTDYLQLNGISAHDHDRISTHRVYTGVGVTF